MLDSFYQNITTTSNVPVVIISISLILFLGFLMTRLTKLLRLPNVTAYIITGILIGPYCLNLIPDYVVHGMDFITDISLAFIAFSVGEFFKLSSIKKNGIKTVIITLFEALITSSLVFILTYNILHLPFAFAIVLSALASATAPAATVMTIRQTKSHGDFVDTLLQVVALDDFISLLTYSVAISIALATTNNTFSLGTILLPIVTNILAIILSIVFGFLLKHLMSEKRTKDNRLIVSIAILLAYCGVCAAINISPLLGCITMGMVYINITEDDKLFKQLNYFSPPILLIFFVLSGIKFDIGSLLTHGSIGTISLLTISILYAITRIFGKYLGSFIGCRLTNKRKDISYCLGMGLIPQASVAIGLATLGARTLNGTIGDTLLTIIVASSIISELIGPACTKLALYLTKSYSNTLEDLVDVELHNLDGSKKSNVDLLIERINKIQNGLPKRRVPVEVIDNEEESFNEAIENYEEGLNNKFRFRRR